MEEEVKEKENSEEEYFHEKPHVVGNVNGFEYDEDDYQYADNNLDGEELPENKSKVVFMYIGLLLVIFVVILIILLKVLG